MTLSLEKYLTIQLRKAQRNENFHITLFREGMESPIPLAFDEILLATVHEQPYPSLYFTNQRLLYQRQEDKSVSLYWADIRDCQWNIDDTEAVRWIHHNDASFSSEDKRRLKVSYLSKLIITDTHHTRHEFGHQCRWVLQKIFERVLKGNQQHAQGQ